MSAKLPIPEHVAIIMDGNGRWAVQRGLPKIAGHNAGADSARDMVAAALEIGIKALTLYAFSTENWKRPKDEVDGIFKLLENFIDREAEKLHKNNIKFWAIGRLDRLPESIRNKIRKLQELTAENNALRLNIALNYGSRLEITDAARGIAEDVSNGVIKLDDINEELFSSYLYTKGLPDPELLIRTSGEFRISNFLLWQISYSEIYISDKLWPDFKKDDLKRIIFEYQNRERRFGG